jgi:hypothetical protein
MITIHNNSSKKPVITSIVDDPHKGDKKSITDNNAKAFANASAITWESPTKISETQTETHLQDAFMGNVNRARLCEIAIGGDASVIRASQYCSIGDLMSTSFGNWRKKSVNGFADISYRVQLQMDDCPTPSYSVNYATKDLGELVLKNKLANTVSKASEIVNNAAVLAGTIAHDGGLLKKVAVTSSRGSLYHHFPALDVEGTKTTANPGEMKFTFKFGQAGIFSGEEEVVKPVLALISRFTLKAGGYHSISGPFPSTGEASAKAVEETVKYLTNNLDLGGILKGATKFDGGNIATNVIGGFVTAFNGLTDVLYQVIDSVAEGCWGLVTSITFIMGSLIQGPFICKSMSWGFDFNNVDEYGYPCEGWVKFDELEPIRYLVNGDYASQWGYTKSSSTVSSDADTGKSGSFDKGADNYFNANTEKLEYQ